MKKTLHFISIPFCFASGKYYKTLLSLFLFTVGYKSVSAQCSAQLNWDAKDFLNSSLSSYTSFYSSATFPYNQNFAIGPRTLNFAIAPTGNITLNGENGSNTAHSGSFSTAGDDVQFTTTSTSNTTITLTFDINVSDVQFSMFDLDASQRVNFTATNAASTAQNITVALANGASGITITGSGTTSATATGPAGSYAGTDNNGTINVTITGPVKTIVLTLSNATGDLWLGDIDACVTGSFPVNYFNAMQPYTGQPTYIIATSDSNTVSLINVATGQATMIFQDPSSPRYINGLGYDHINNELYYVVDFTSTPSSNRSLKKYNFNTGAITTVVTDVRTIGIPTFSRGVESAGCAFYDGALYFGIEGNGSSQRENIVWRINFDGSGNVTGTSQVWAINCGSTTHDWGDFALRDSVLVDFNSASSTRTYTHFNMFTGQTVNTFTAPTSNPPRQTGITWNDTLYWVYDSIAMYNGNGTIGARTRITGATLGDWTGFCGDATGFRPQSDFGDAPSSYDPVALSPALHMKDTTLRLGATFDQEFVKTSSLYADADGADEDAIAAIPLLDTGLTTYLVDVNVYNNIGANATLIGWLDIDGDGTFEASEAVSATVSSSTNMQTISLAWVNINTPLTLWQATYLRIRLTSAANGMTVNNPTGYYSLGEVEDYFVWVGTTLPVELISFTAKADNKSTVTVTWSVEGEKEIDLYEIERSMDGNNWTSIGSTVPLNDGNAHTYSFKDEKALMGKSYYRLKIMEPNNRQRYSQTEIVIIESEIMNLHLKPNPVSRNATVSVFTSSALTSTFRIINSTGTECFSQKFALRKGDNTVTLKTDLLPAGFYILLVETGESKKAIQFIKK